MAEEKAKKPMNPFVREWIIPIAVLVCICLVCVLLLALANDLLYIDDNTRLERAMQKVYDKFVLDKEVSVVAANATNSSYGKVNKVYLSKDGAYVIEALGTGGYQGGSVTLYVVVGADAKIIAWAVKENDKQSYIDRVPSNAGTTWYVGKEVSNELELEMTGATVQATSTAIKNAVNMAAYYARTTLGLGKNPTGEATKAIQALLEANGYTVNNLTNSSATIRNIKDGNNALSDILAGDSDTWSYTFIGTTDSGSSIAVHVFNWDEEYKFDSLDGIPTATKIVAVKLDEVVAKHNVADGDALLDRATSYPLYYVGGSALYAYITNTDDAATYTIVSVSPGYTPRNYTLTVTIELDGDHGVVDSIVITETGFVDYGPDEADTRALETALKGATLATIDGLYETGKVAGATESANLIMAAVRAALAHYDANLASGN